LLLQWGKLVTVKKIYIHPASDTLDVDDDLHDTYTEHVIFSFKNKKSFRPPPRLARRVLRLAPSGTPSGPIWYPVWPPSGTPSGRHRVEKKIKKKICLVVVAGWKRGQKIFQFSVFNPQHPQAPQIPQVPQVPRASRAKPREEEGFFGLVPLVTHPSSIPLLGGLTPKFLSLSFHSF
jgi:hypothetical protein